MKLIKISAIDGAGKSTVTELLSDRFHEDNLNVTTIHWTTDSLLPYFPSRSGFGSLVLEKLFRAKKYMKREVRNDGENSDSSGASSSTHRRLYKSLIVIKFLFVILNYVVMSLYINLLYRKFDYIILDRNFHDDVLQLEYLGLPTIFVEAGYKITDMSNLFCIDVPSELAKERDWESDGHQHPDAYYRKKIDLYRRNIKKYNIHRLDGTNTQDEVLEEILNHLEL